MVEELFNQLFSRQTTFNWNDGYYYLFTVKIFLCSPKATYYITYYIFKYWAILVINYRSKWHLNWYFSRKKKHFPRFWVFTTTAPEPTLAIYVLPYFESQPVNPFLLHLLYFPNSSCSVCECGCIQRGHFPSHLWSQLHQVPYSSMVSYSPL